MFPKDDCQFSIINSIEELFPLVSERVAHKNGIILEIPVVKLKGITVICLSDIALQLNYKECGILISHEIIRLSFGFDKIDFCGKYLTQDKTLINISETYTIKISPGSVFNLIANENVGKASYEFVIKKEANQPDRYVLYAFLFLLFSFLISVMIIFFKYKLNLYSSEEEYTNISS